MTTPLTTNPPSSSVTHTLPPSFTSIAPGRLCLFGEHQDYLHLPVIALALPLYCRIHVTTERAPPSPSSSPTAASDSKIIIILQVPQLQQSFTYDLDQLPSTACNEDQNVKPDFALAALIDAVHNNSKRIDVVDSDDDGAGGGSCAWDFSHLRGTVTTCVSTTDIPMQAGCSSSSAFCVAWIQVLHKLSHDHNNNHNNNNNNNRQQQQTQHNEDDDSAYVPLTPLQLAKRAHHAEVVHFGAPGGNMDHITSAFGGIVRIGAAATSNGDPWHVERLPPLLSSSASSCIWMLVDSGEPKDTIKHLQRCKHDRIQLLHNKLQGNWDCLPLPPPTEAPHATLAEAAEVTTTTTIHLSDTERQLLDATIINRDTEVQAASIWNSILKEHSSNNHQQLHKELAQLMNQHHAALRDGLLLSTPRLEQLREVAFQAGAMGFKLVGSGGGGCGVAWLPPLPPPIASSSSTTTTQHSITLVDAVEEALQRAGAKTTWRITSASRGAFIEA